MSQYLERYRDSIESLDLETGLDGFPEPLLMRRDGPWASYYAPFEPELRRKSGACWPRVPARGACGRVLAGVAGASGKPDLLPAREGSGGSAGLAGHEGAGSG